jgi:hypothetical protein
MTTSLCLQAASPSSSSGQKMYQPSPTTRQCPTSKCVLSSTAAHAVHVCKSRCIKDECNSLVIRASSTCVPCLDWEGRTKQCISSC